MNFIDTLIKILSQVWYLLPLFMLLTLFKVFINKKERELKEERTKQKQRDFYKKNEKNGKEFEKLTGKKFEELGYKVIYHGLEKGKLDQGIDLICNKDGKIILIQCKNYTNSNSITHEDIKIFHSNAIIYMKKNYLDETDTELKYAIPKEDILDYSAKKTLMDKYYNCEYSIIN